MSLEKLRLRGLGRRVEGSGCKNLCCRARDWREKFMDSPSGWGFLKTGSLMSTLKCWDPHDGVRFLGSCRILLVML